MLSAVTRLDEGIQDLVVSPAGDAPTLVCRPFLGGDIFEDEMIVLAHVAVGYSDQAIAEGMASGLGKVRWLARCAIAKLGARNRPHAVTRAIALGYLELRPK
jgi:DNA-binding CsgD family transcriptional regulator